MSNPTAPLLHDEEKKSNMYPNPNTPYPPPPHGAATHSNVGFATQHQPNLGGPPPNLGGPPPNLGGPPPNYGGPPTMPPTTQTTFVYVADHSFGPKSIQMTCPHCHQQVITRVKYNPGLLTWLLVGGCIVFGFWLGCCLIPLCIDDCQVLFPTRTCFYVADLLRGKGVLIKCEGDGCPRKSGLRKLGD